MLERIGVFAQILLGVQEIVSLHRIVDRGFGELLAFLDVAETDVRQSLVEQHDAFVAAAAHLPHQRQRLLGVLERLGEVAGLEVGVAEIEVGVREPLGAVRARGVIERREAGAPLRRTVAAPVRDVRCPNLHLGQRRFIADRRRQAPRALELVRGAIVVAGIGVNVREPEHRVDAALIVVHVAGEIQRLLEKWQRRLGLPEGPQGVAPEYRHAIALRVGVDRRHVDLVEFLASRRIFGVLVMRVGAHVVFGQHGGLIAVLGDRLELRDRRINVGIAAGVHQHHRPNFEELHFGGAPLRKRRRIDDLLGARRVRPIEHLDSIGKGQVGRPGGRAGSPSQETDQGPFSTKPHSRQH